MGITNELFQTERDETPTCQFTTGPNTVTNTTGATPQETISAIEKFTFFMRFLAPPAPSLDTPGGAASVARGKTLFSQIGCALCHTPTLYTGISTVAALGNQTVNLYSDLLVHDMGIGLADGVSQGRAGPREFRSAPLWGLGKRVFFLHDGRTANLGVHLHVLAAALDEKLAGLEIVAFHRELRSALQLVRPLAERVAEPRRFGFELGQAQLLPDHLRALHVLALG